MLAILLFDFVGLFGAEEHDVNTLLTYSTITQTKIGKA